MNRFYDEALISMQWRLYMRRTFGAAVFITVAALLLYAGMLVIKLDLFDSRLMFVLMALAFLSSSPLARMKR